MPNNNYDDEVEIDLIDLFKTLWRRKGLIIFLSFIFGVGATIHAFTAPFVYRAECRFVPPGGGGAGGIVSQLGGLASFMGASSIGKTPGQTMLGILKGNSVVDAIIDRFNLMEEMQQEIRLNARRTVLGTLETTEDAQSGIISVAYIHKDPKIAADIANAFVDELQKKVREINFQDAQERRAFFENQLLAAQQELAEAEDAMMKYQQSSGVLALGSQTASMLGAIASLRNQIAAKNVEISSLASYAREDNPRLKLARSQLEAITRELHRLEEEQKRTEHRQGRALSSDLISTIANVPEINVEYARHERNLRFANVKYDTMLRQYENARLSEANDISTLQIIDPATPPDWKYKPQRARIMLIGTFIGFFLGCGWVFVKYMIKLHEASHEEDYDDE